LTFNSASPVEVKFVWCRRVLLHLQPNLYMQPLLYLYAYFHIKHVYGISTGCPLLALWASGPARGFILTY